MDISPNNTLIKLSASVGKTEYQSIDHAIAIGVGCARPWSALARGFCPADGCQHDQAQQCGASVISYCT